MEDWNQSGNEKKHPVVEDVRRHIQLLHFTCVAKIKDHKLYAWNSVVHFLFRPGVKSGHSTACPSVRIPHLCATAPAVWMFLSVTVRTFIPAEEGSLTAVGTPSRKGSLMPTHTAVAAPMVSLDRGRGLFARSCMKAQLVSPTFTHIFAALVAEVNTKLPEVGELLLKRLILQLRKAYKRFDKPALLAAAKFVAHLSNQQVAHEIIALQLLTLLLEKPSEDL